LRGVFCAPGRGGREDEYCSNTWNIEERSEKFMTSEDVTLYSISLCGRRSWRVGSIKTRIETIPESRRQKAVGE
jgi:hypothetical protein